MCIAENLSPMRRGMNSPRPCALSFPLLRSPCRRMHPDSAPRRDSGPAGTSYDVVPYVSKSFPQCHPDRLAVLGKLFGMMPAPVGRCRVLELGCASGGNLLPAAMHSPESRFVGLDASGRQIADGRAAIEATGLSNIELRHADILDLDESWGTFDYILCHGVFSWVPQPVQEKILSFCRSALNPQGIAYISYNVLPGWRMRGMVREMLRFHADGFAEPAKRVTQARAMLDFLAQTCILQNSPYAMHLRRELEVLGKCSDEYVFHEHLEDTNEAFYFHEFAERLEKHDLCYLAEAEFAMMAVGNFSEPIQERLEVLGGNIIRLEQYMDFLRNRLFRQTLLCRGDVRLDRTIGPERTYELFAASNLVPRTETPDVRTPDAPETFMAPGGIEVEYRQPVSKAVFAHLATRWPRPLAFDELVGGVRELLHLSPRPTVPEDRALREEIGRVLLLNYGIRTVELHAAAVPLALEAGPFPSVTPLARLQAASDGPHPGATNLRHEVVSLDALERRLVPLLDGTRDRAALLAALRKLFEDNVLRIHLDGETPPPDVLDRSLPVALEAALDRLARKGLLEG